MGEVQYEVGILERLRNRLRSRGHINVDTGCVEYQGTRTTWGYGLISQYGLHESVHRLAYELWNGPVPKGMIVRHSCDNPPCFNPEHLLIGTTSDNAKDRVERNPGAILRGEQLNHNKLTASDVLKIKELAETGMTGGAIQRQFFPHVTDRTVRNVIAKRRWAHIQGANDGPSS